LRLDQRGNKFEGSELTIPEVLQTENSQTKQRAQIEGWIYRNRVTFIRREGDSLIGTSFAGSFDAADSTVQGTWYAGVDKGSWSMQRTGDLVGDVNDFVSPEFSNPPGDKSGEQTLEPAITQGPHLGSEVSKVPAQQMESNRISGPAPVYPPIAKASRIEGDVLLEARISKDGVVESVQVLTGPAMLQQSAAEAVKHWRYKPFLWQGDPVEVVTQVNVSFKLNN
jgi:TonB family protein